MEKKIASLFVETNGIYFSDAMIDPWDIERDAFKYKGPHPVIAHPPCKRWGRYWSGGPSAKIKRIKGADDNSFAHSLWCARTFGGVIEHPEASHAYEWFGIKRPVLGGWIKADNWGYTTCVAQGNYGHRARKLTWLYVVNGNLIDLDWSVPKKERLDEGFHSKEERDKARLMGQKPVKRLSEKENLATPRGFKRLLKQIVNTTTYNHTINSQVAEKREN